MRFPVVIAVVVILAACSSSTSDSLRPEPQATSAATPGDTAVAQEAASEPAVDEPSESSAGAAERGELGPLATLLDRLPLAALVEAQSAQTAWIEVRLGDYDAASALAGTARPPATDVEASFSWLSDFTRGPSIDAGGTGFAFHASGYPDPARLGSADEMAEEIGFSPFEVDRYATLTMAQSGFAVFEGDLKLRDDLVHAGNGIRTAGAGEDYEINIDERTALRHLGRPHHFAAADGLIAASHATRPLESWLAGGPSLFDYADLAAAASALDDGGAVTASLVVGTFAILEPPPGVGADEVAERVSESFGVVGIGVTSVDGRPASVVTYVFGDEQAARSAAPGLERGWSEPMPVGGTIAVADFYRLESVVQTGRTVTVTATVTDAGSTLRAVEMRLRSEPMFTYDG